MIAESFWSVLVFVLFIFHSSANSPDRPGACVQLLSSLSRAEQKGDIAGNMTVSCSRLSILSYVTFLSRCHYSFILPFGFATKVMVTDLDIGDGLFLDYCKWLSCNGSSSVCVTFILFCCFRKPMTMFKSFSA